MNSQSLIRETIASVNRDSGVTNNMMAYRLSIVIEASGASIKPNAIIDEQQRQNSQSELRKILTTNTQGIEQYRQDLKQKYLSEYLTNFGATFDATQQSQEMKPVEVSRVDKLIASRKDAFIQEIIESSKEVKPTSISSVNKSDVNRQPEAVQADKSHLSQPDEVTKKTLIPAVLETIIAKGENTPNGRSYEGVFYKLQLLIEKGKQLVNIERKNDQNGEREAFLAYKDSTNNEFTITKNNLSPEEVQTLITFNKQRIAKESAREKSQPPVIENDKKGSAELGD
jgi:hypothetical protein